MDEIITYISDLLGDAIGAALTSITHNWLALSLAILTAAAMTAFINVEKMKAALLRKPKVSILTSVLVGALTPLCACGTMAVVIGILTTALPWGPVMAFLTSSPLMSPDGFIMLAGVIGTKFAIALAAASIIVGLGSGFLTHLIEKTGFLKNQTRFADASAAVSCGCGADPEPQQSCGCGADPEPQISCGCGSEPKQHGRRNAELKPIEPCGCGSAASTEKEICCTEAADCKQPQKESKIQAFVKALYNVGVKQILLYFCIFVAVGYLINAFVPTSLIMTLFSANSIFSVPLASLIGLPLYVSGEAAIPLIKALMNSGAGGGAMLAFMITGPGTSAWVIAGISVFMKKRAIGLYVSFILLGGIVLGYLYDFLIALGL
jgi:uncharacterized membrane protein YraQ (UPF0718 family)